MALVLGTLYRSAPATATASTVTHLSGWLRGQARHDLDPDLAEQLLAAAARRHHSVTNGWASLLLTSPCSKPPNISGTSDRQLKQGSDQSHEEAEKSRYRNSKQKVET